MRLWLHTPLSARLSELEEVVAAFCLVLFMKSSSAKRACLRKANVIRSNFLCNLCCIGIAKQVASGLHHVKSGPLSRKNRSTSLRTRFQVFQIWLVFHIVLMKISIDLLTTRILVHFCQLKIYIFYNAINLPLFYILPKGS